MGPYLFHVGAHFVRKSQQLLEVLPAERAMIMCSSTSSAATDRLKERHADAGWLWGFWHRTCLSAQGCETQRRLMRKMGWVGGGGGEVPFVESDLLIFYWKKTWSWLMTVRLIQSNMMPFDCKTSHSQIPSRRHFPIKRLKCIEVWFHQLPQIQMHGKPCFFCVFLRQLASWFWGFLKVAGFPNNVGNFPG